MLKRLKAVRGSIFNADRAYDAEYIFKHIYKLGMKPNIKQRNMLKGEGRKRLKYRMKASKEFDEQTYHHRGLKRSSEEKNQTTTNSKQDSKPKNTKKNGAK